MKLGDILINMGAITELDLLKALRNKPNNELLGVYLLKSNLISNKDCIEALSIQSSIPTIDLDSIEPNKELSAKLKQAFCIKHKLIPFKIEDNTISIAVADPYDLNTRDLINNILSGHTEYYLTDEKSIENFTNSIYSADVKESTNSALRVKSIEMKTTTNSNSDILDKLDPVSNDAVVSYLNQIVINAKTRNVSDIHIDAHKDKVLIRFRIDGVLVDIDYLDNIFLNNLVRHIKIRSKLDTTLNRVPQDGRFVVKTSNNSEIDIRASIMPTMYGEKCVMRILDKDKTIPTLETIGLLASDYNKIMTMLKKPQGIILVCGPTGSGKSTTSTSILNKLVSSEMNIMTLEDPIEYVIPGVNQSNIDVEAGYTFQKGLRTILRQDPDIILIGEIRDEETARMAISAATTGHLVVSTLHTNDSIGAITRLRDMGIEGYHIADTLIGVISQRLIRKLCPFCSKPSAKDTEIIRSKFKKATESLNVKMSVGCSKCYQGFKGRLPLNEVLIINNDLKDAIYRKAQYSELLKVATENGFEQITVAAYKHIILGNTTYEEVDKLLGGAL